MARPSHKTLVSSYKHAGWVQVKQQLTSEALAGLRQLAARGRLPLGALASLAIFIWTSLQGAQQAQQAQQAGNEEEQAQQAQQAGSREEAQRRRADFADLWWRRWVHVHECAGALCTATLSVAPSSILLSHVLGASVHDLELCLVLESVPKFFKDHLPPTLCSPCMWPAGPDSCSQCGVQAAGGH